MKKILVLSLIVFMCGCDRKLNEVSVADVPFASVIKFSYNGHSYLKFSEGGGDCQSCGVAHDPDCQCYQEPSDAEYQMGYEDGLKDQENKDQ